MSIEVTVTEQPINLTVTDGAVDNITVSGISSIEINPGSLPGYEYVQQVSINTASTGVVTGGVIIQTGYHEYMITAGTGQVALGVNTIVSWAAKTGLVPPYDGANIINLDYNGDLVITSVSDETGLLMELGAVFTGLGNTVIIEVVGLPITANDVNGKIGHLIANAFRALIVSGLDLVEQSTPNELHLTAHSGTSITSLTSVVYAEISTFNKFYLTSDYGWVPSAINPNMVDPGYVNDVTKTYGNALVLMTSGYWKKDLVFRVPSGNMYYIYGQNEYSTRRLANEAPLPIVPVNLNTIAVYLAVIISKGSDTSIADRIQDIRPLMSRTFEKTTLEDAYLPTGGTAGYALTKNTGEDYDYGFTSLDPAGNDKAVQYNDGGVKGGSDNLRFNKNSITLSVGIPDSLPDNPLALGGSVETWLQANIQNTNEGATASSDLVVTADNGTDLENYGCLWVASSIYDDSAGYPTIGPNDVVVEAEGPSLHLICWRSGGKIPFLIGGVEEANIQAYFDETGLVVSPGKTIKIGASSQPVPEIYYGTGSPPSATGLADGTMFFKYA